MGPEDRVEEEPKTNPMESELGSSEARQFETLVIDLQDEAEPKQYKNGEFWIAGDLLFVNIDGPHADTAQLKIFNIRWVKQVSLTYGV